MIVVNRLNINLDILTLFQTPRAHHCHSGHSIVLIFCEETRELRVECILYTRLENVTPSSVIWKLTSEAGR